MWCCTLPWIFQIWTIIYWRSHLFLRLEDQIMWRTLVFTVDHEHPHPKLLPFRPGLTYDLSWEASKILGFSKVLKVQPLDICSFDQAQQFVFYLMHELLLPHQNSETKVSVLSCVWWSSLEASSLMHQQAQSWLLFPLKSWWHHHPFSTGLPQSCSSLLEALTTSYFTSLLETA